MTFVPLAPEITFPFETWSIITQTNKTMSPNVMTQIILSFVAEVVSAKPCTWRVLPLVETPCNTVRVFGLL